MHGADQEKSFHAQRWRADLKLDPAETNRPSIAREQPVLRTRPAPVPTPTPPRYAGPTSGTLESSGILIPQNAEYVFHNVPLTNIQLDYDHKVWEARLAPDDGHTQRLIVKNKGSGPQKRCVVLWRVVPQSRRTLRKPLPRIGISTVQPPPPPGTSYIMRARGFSAAGSTGNCC
jgi:hypothetical protein